MSLPHEFPRQTIDNMKSPELTNRRSINSRGMITVENTPVGNAFPGPGPIPSPIPNQHEIGVANLKVDIIMITLIINLTII